MFDRILLTLSKEFFNSVLLIFYLSYAPFFKLKMYQNFQKKVNLQEN